MQVEDAETPVIMQLADPLEDIVPAEPLEEADIEEPPEPGYPLEEDPAEWLEQDLDIAEYLAAGVQNIPSGNVDIFKSRENLLMYMIFEGQGMSKVGVPFLFHLFSLKIPNVLL